MCRVERVSALGCWLLAVGLPASAHAHGGRPQTSDVLFGASADDMVIASTFGTMTTLDGGATWQWICMESMPDATRGVIRPAVRTTDDTILFAQHFGLLEGHDRACDPVYEATLQNEYVADVTAIPGGGYAALPSDPTVVNRLYTSVDGAVFAPLGDAFPADFLPERVRYAPGDPMRVYVSGETPGSATSRYTASLFVSDDGGSHWTGIDVPLVDGETVLRVLDVDPHDPDRAFLVAQSSMTDRLIEVTMAGATLTDRLVIPAVSVAVNRPFGFAFAADGAIWFGNTMAGLFRMLPGDTPRSIDKFLHTACVVAHDDDVYFCGDGLIDAFAVGVQHPGPEYAPVPLMRFAQLTVPRMCGEPTDGLCVRWWDDLLRDTGRGDLVPDAGDADAGPTSGTDAGAPSPAASCGCRTAGDTHASRRMAVLVAVLAAALGGRLRPRRRSGIFPACPGGSSSS